MASSREPVVAPAEQEVRWPLIARIGVALAALTILAAIVAAVVAAFVVDREEAWAAVVVEDAVVRTGGDAPR